MFHLIEPLSGGLVNSRDPALLSPGQLPAMRNATYRRGSQALQRARGREVFAVVTAAAADIGGLADAQFDNGDHFLLALANESGLARLRASVVGEGALATGSFRDVGNIPRQPGATTLELAHFRNRFYAFQGVIATAAADNTTNLAIYLSATAIGQSPLGRQHGMQPVIIAPSISTAAGIFSSTVTGYYEYWTTEVANFPTDSTTVSIESTFSGKPTTIFVNSTGIVPTIPRPPSRNPIVSRWRIYRSPMKPDTSTTLFPTGFLVGELSKSITTFSDRNAITTSSYINPTVAGQPNTTSASAGFTSNSTYFSFLTYQNYANFPFGGGIVGVVGIEVAVKAYATPGTAPVSVGVKLGRFDTSGNRLDSVLPFGAGVADRYGAKNASLSATASATDATLTLGGSTDMWTSYIDSNTGQRQPSYILTDADFNALNVGVEISHDSLSPIFLDSVSMRVYSSGSSVTELPFPAIIVDIAGETSSVGRNGPPPNSSTGDFFNDQLVVNDLSNRSIIRYSAAGDPEAFPSIYFLDFETRQNDIVTAIRTINNRLVVLLAQSLWRVNYLPSEQDANFGSGRGECKQPISQSFGCVNSACTCTFSIAGGQEQIAFVSNHGIHATDGYSFTTLTDDVKWRDIISTSSTSFPIALVNDPEQHELVFYYRNDSFQTETYLTLRLHYSREHSSPGRLKLSGPVNMRNWSTANGLYAGLKSAWPVTQLTGETLIYYGYGASPTSDQVARPIADLGANTGWFTQFTVASCSTTAGSTTVTTTNSFANVSVGATAAGNGIIASPATTVATVLATSLTLSVTASATNSATLTFTGSTINRWATVDEVSPAVVTDFIYSSETNVALANPLELLLTSSTASNDLSGMVFIVNCRKTGGISAAETIIFKFLTDASLTPWATRTVTSLSAGFTRHSFAFTAAERLALGNFNYISVRITGTTALSGTTISSAIEIAWLELRIPDVGSTSPGAGKVYVETGINLPALDPAMSFTTRRMYLGGRGGQGQAFGKEWLLDTVYTYLSSSLGTPTLSYTARSTKTNFAGEVALQSPEITLAGETFYSTSFKQAGEGISVTMDTLSDHADTAFEFLEILGDSLGDEDTGIA